MSGSLEPYTALVKEAHSGALKLPAFQRDWKWRRNQVMLLFDSIRQRFPIGSFLFLKEGPDVDLSPREFRGSQKNARAQTPSRLVLDGQQRLTAGIELFYGSGSTHYFVDLQRLFRLFKEGEHDISSRNSINKFLYNLDAEDGYLLAKPRQSDPQSLLLKSNLLWTPTLFDEDELSRAIRRIGNENKELADFCDFVVRTNFRPSDSVIIPVTVVGEDTTVEAICRIFSTLNSTGKILTPFEIVAAVLFPDEIRLQEDVDVAKEAYPYYSQIDEFGDILLQTIALFDGKDTKKASLPKTITKHNYRLHYEEAAKYLNEAGKLMTQKAGLGLDRSSELLVYPVVFPPMAFVMRWLEQRNWSIERKVAAERKLVRWLYAAILSRRYQQSTHDKQAKDKNEIIRWLETDGDEHIPSWFADVFIPRSLMETAPSSALGKLVLCILNSERPADPLTQKQVGFGANVEPTAKHHIFPTRYMQHVEGWSSSDNNNLAVNIMLVEAETNAVWLNSNPSEQISQSKSILGNTTSENIYRNHFIDGDLLRILSKEKKNKEDFQYFIEARAGLIEKKLNDYGFQKAAIAQAEELELE